VRVAHDDVGAVDEEQAIHTGKEALAGSRIIDS